MWSRGLICPPSPHDTGIPHEDQFVPLMMQFPANTLGKAEEVGMKT